MLTNSFDRVTSGNQDTRLTDRRKQPTGRAVYQSSGPEHARASVQKQPRITKNTVSGYRTDKKKPLRIPSGFKLDLNGKSNAALAYILDQHILNRVATNNGGDSRRDLTLDAQGIYHAPLLTGGHIEPAMKV